MTQGLLIVRRYRKCAKFVVGKKSAVGDRPATRKHERPISWDSLPFATAPMVTSQDAAAQTTRVSADPCCATSMCLLTPLRSSWRSGAKTGSPRNPKTIWSCKTELELNSNICYETV